MTGGEQSAYRELSDRLLILSAMAVTLATGCRDADGRAVVAEACLRDRLLHELVGFYRWSGIVCPPSSSSARQESPPGKK